LYFILSSASFIHLIMEFPPYNTFKCLTKQKKTVIK